MSRLKVCLVLLLTICAYGNGVNESRMFKRLHIPLLGLGPHCTGCPQRFCDDDPVIVQGFCCGCARVFDFLPVICQPNLSCPLNPYNLCQHYEYLMHCCCGNP